jgi:hypothetical protein
MLRSVCRDADQWSAPHAVPVSGVARPIEVKIASEHSEWEEAFRLVAANYQAIGAEPYNPCALRFTPYHALPDTVTFVAKEKGWVLATLSLVLDNVLLGLPAEALYSKEIVQLRHTGRRIAEVTGLAAARELGMAEFLPVLIVLARMLTNYSILKGADVLVITCRPSHGLVYRNLLGFKPFGPRRNNPAVQDYSTEGYLLDVPLLKDSAPAMYRQIVENQPPAEALLACRVPVPLVRYFAEKSSQADRQRIELVLEHDANGVHLRAWR